MTDLMTPPPEHDLPPARAVDIRQNVLRSAARAPRRRARVGARLLLPVLAALAVMAALIGLRPGQAPSVVGSPSPAPSATASPSSPSDRRVDTDGGPLSDADAAAMIKKLDGRASWAGASDVAHVIVARRTTTDLGDGTFVVWTDTAGSTWWDADTRGVMGSGGPVSGPLVKTVLVPDAAHPVVRLGTLTLGWREDADRPDATARDLHTESVYLVSGSVDRVEVRMTVEGEPGPWFTAPVFAGYSYIPAVTPGPHSTSEHIDTAAKIEDRAFDRDGRLIPIVER